MILVNKEEPTNNENLGSAFLSFDEQTTIKPTKWYVNNSHYMRKEWLEPIAKRINLDNKDILVRPASRSPFNPFDYYFHFGGYFLNKNDGEDGKFFYYLDVMHDNYRNYCVEKNLKEDLDFETQHEKNNKQGLLSKLFGKKED